MEMGMSPDVLLGVVTVTALPFFISRRVPNEIVALSMLAAMIVLRLIPISEAFSGFSHGALIAVASFLVLSEALVRTGAVSILSRALFASSPRRLLALLIVIAGFFSAWMSNTALCALFIPLVFEATRDKKIAPSLLLLPLSYALMIGGTFTLIGTSSSIFGAALAKEIGGPALDLFAPLPFSVIVFAAFAVYLLFYGHKRLPILPLCETRAGRIDLRDYMTQARILPGSPLIGKEIHGEYLRKTHDLDILALRRGGGFPELDGLLEAGDIMLIRGGIDATKPLADFLCIEIDSDLSVEKMVRETGGFEYVEVIVGANASHVGHPISDLRLYERFGARVLGVKRRGRLRLRRVGDMLLSFGDILFVRGPGGIQESLEETREFVFRNRLELPVERRARMPFAVVAVVSVVMLSGLGVVPIAAAAFTGAVFVVITGCVTPSEMQKAANLSVLLLIGALIPFSLAFQGTGLADRVAAAIAREGAGLGPRVALLLVVVVSSALAHMIQPNGVVALMIPLAVTTASALGVNAEPFVIGVLCASIYVFATPFSYQTNAMVAHEAGYTFQHFARTGAPLLLIFYALAYLLLPVFYPF